MDTFDIISIMKLTKKRLVPGPGKFPMVVETTIWTNREMEKFKKMLKSKIIIKTKII